MGRLLVLTAIIGVTVYLIKKIYLEKPAIQEQDVKVMKKCAHCGMHLPSEKGIFLEENFFCNEQHRDQFLSS
jgi:hypothetical protein